MLYTYSDTPSDALQKAREKIHNNRSTGYIGTRGRMLVKKFSKRLGESILWYRTNRPQDAIRRGINCIFITLTLPAAQVHEDGYLNRHALNRFITVMRRKGHINHYVWRAEVQKNGNMHWHIISDKEVDYQIVREEWNAIMSDLGYIQLYADKMSKLTLQEYLKVRKVDTDKALAAAMAHYHNSVKEGWSDPNSVDVKRVNSVKSLRQYIAKYVAKGSVEGVRGLKARHWGASDSLRDVKEVRFELSPSDVMHIMTIATQMGLRIVGLEHITYINTTIDELRILSVEFYEKLHSVMQSNMFLLWGCEIARPTLEVSEEFHIDAFLELDCAEEVFYTQLELFLHHHTM